MTLKLKSITFANTPKFPGLRQNDVVTIQCLKDGPLRGFRASVRGPAVFLISPPGWDRDQSPSRWDPKGPVTIYEVPRAECAFQWEGMPADIDTILKGKYESPPFGLPEFEPVSPMIENGALTPPQSQLGDA